MACRVDDTGFASVLELLSESGFDGMAKAMEALMNAAMLLERERYIGAGAYERNEQRRTHANGFKSKSVKTRIGELSLEVPQTRDSEFYPASLEKGIRSERALKLALAEMYVKGVSTRRVAKITEQMCGFTVSSTQVSRVSAELDEELTAWRQRRLGRYRVVILDARYEKVRHAGEVVNSAVLIAIGVTCEGKREVIGVSVALSEAEVHWRTFLTDLHERGLHGVELFVSDAHEGLKAARTAVYTSVKWQRCQFHLQQNAQAYVPKHSMKAEVAQTIRNIFNAPDAATAKELLDRAIATYGKTAPKLAEWMETNIPEGLTIFSFPEKVRKRLRTSNSLERVNEEIKRRTRVARIFPNEASCLRLISAILIEISQEWETGKRYLSF